MTMRFKAGVGAALTMAVLAAIALSDPRAAATPEHAETLHVSWADRPEDVIAMIDRAPVVVEARVSAINPGTPLTSVETLDDGTQETVAIPTQRIAFRTLSTSKGAAPATFDLWKTGSENVAIEGDPPYAAGERYLLFMEPRLDGAGQPDGSYIPVAPDGRLTVDADNVLHEVIDGPVGDTLEGQRLEAVALSVTLYSEGCGWATTTTTTTAAATRSAAQQPLPCLG